MFLALRFLGPQPMNPWTHPPHQCENATDAVPTPLAPMSSFVCVWGGILTSGVNFIKLDISKISNMNELVSYTVQLWYRLVCTGKPPPKWGLGT